ncbi:MAG: hypothetical protein Q7R95_02320 [bacterium]|nr:hypothetical protein [bacterium]
MNKNLQIQRQSSPTGRENLDGTTNETTLRTGNDPASSVQRFVRRFFDNFETSFVTFFFLMTLLGAIYWIYSFAVAVHEHRHLFHY